MIKQVIVVRKDLNMRKGKIAAQVAHASMKVILDLFWEEPQLKSTMKMYKIFDMESPEYKWLKDKFTKICVSVDSEQELIDIYEKAKGKGMLCSLIEDSGATEFKGVPTKTCCAIGPDESHKIDMITGHLKLL